MSIISEKAAYLRGLAEGLKISSESDEGKLLNEIINVIGAIAEDIEYLDDSQDELFDRVYDLEDVVYEDEGDDFDFDHDDEDEQYAMSCPSCKEDFFISFSELDGDDDIVCPNCNEMIELEFDCDCDCDECGDD